MKVLIIKTSNPIKIPATGTKKERLAHIERLSREFCEELDEFLDNFESKTHITKKSLNDFYSRILPGLNIRLKKLPRFDTEELKTRADMCRTDFGYYLRLAPLPAREQGFLSRILNMFKPVKFMNTKEMREELKHESTHIISQSIRGDVFTNQDIKRYYGMNMDFAYEFQNIVYKEPSNGIFRKNEFIFEIEDLLKTHNASDYEKIKILSSLKKIIEDEKLAHNIMGHKKGISKEQIEQLAAAIEEKFAFEQKITIINAKLSKLLSKKST